MSYLTLKYIHIAAVICTGTLFLLRAGWMLAESSLLTRRWVSILPHLIDTVLLLSALWLAALSQQYPFVHGWLTAKVLALLVYIVLGSIALKRGKSKSIRIVALISALLTFAYIVSVALNKNPLLV